jgi:uncharacterized protein (DUF1330 family)
MTAYLIGRISIKDHTLWQQYVTGVRESLTGYNASLLFRGKKASQLAGEADKDHVVVIRFDNEMVLDHWFKSEKYQQLIPLRDQAADVEISSFTEYE